MNNKGPLEGIRILDLTTTFMGPICTYILAELGADVIKVEAPSGDAVREINRSAGLEFGPAFTSVNRGKRSIVIDLKTPGGRDTLLSLATMSDVFVTNVRRKALDALGLGPSTVREKNPQLIYCQLSGYGHGGPYADRAAYDDIVQAASGLAQVQGGGGDPSYIKAAAADKSAALFAVSAVLAALLERSRQGNGLTMEVPMFEVNVALNLWEMQGGYTYDPPAGPIGYQRLESEYRRPFKTLDGFLSVMPYTDKHWSNFFDAIAAPHLKGDPRFASITERTRHIDDLYSIVDEELRTKTCAEWSRLFDALDIPSMPVKGLTDLFDDEHLESVNFFERTEHSAVGKVILPRLPIDFGPGRRKPLRGAPRLGEHTTEVLSDLGMDHTEIEALERTGAIRQLRN